MNQSDDPELSQAALDADVFVVSDASPLAKQTFAEGWNAPGMEAYDDT